MRLRVTAQRVREALAYDPLTGSLVWRIAARKGSSRVGMEAGTLSDGYRKIKLDGQYLFAHRVIWLHVTGRWPAECIDHINGDRSDNRWTNLREATSRLNSENHRKPSSHNRTSAYLGVSWRACKGKWRARITVENRSIHIGYFEDEAAAHAAYIAAKRQLHAGCSI